MIYYVEDDFDIRNIASYALKASSFEVKGFPSCATFYEALKEELPDLIILDIMLPNEDGLTILKKLKSNDKYKNIPVILASAKGSEYDKVLGLDLGADDYLAKPYGMMELVSRVKAVLRRFKKENNTLLVNGTLEVNTLKHEVKNDEELVTLTSKEYDLLLLLMKNISKVFSREELLENIWDTDFVGESRTVDVHIGTLKKKLKNNGRLIETVRGYGYKMVKNDEKKDI